MVDKLKYDRVATNSKTKIIVDWMGDVILTAQV